jgi:succinate dehydrogenase / fumarate reductase cytochrome b subunit
VKFLTSSIGKKIQMAVSGLLLCGFLVAHLGGNLFLYKGQADFNHYATTLEANPLIPIAEIGLLILFVLHIITGIWTRIENQQARPKGYTVYRASGGRTWGSSTMIFSGLLLLAFLIVHVKNFKFEPSNGDLYGLVTTAFHNKLYSAFYFVAMCALCLHLSHGYQAGFQTLGINHPKYTPWIKRFGLIFAIVIAAGFASIPLWFGICSGVCR